MTRYLHAILSGCALMSVLAAASSQPAVAWYEGLWLAEFRRGDGKLMHAHVRLQGETGTWRTLAGRTAPTDGCAGSVNLNAPVRVLLATDFSVQMVVDYDKVVPGCGVMGVGLAREGAEMKGHVGLTSVRLTRR